MIKCSNCNIEIEEKHCPKCGQYRKTGKLTSFSVLRDFVGNIFSLESSIFQNMKVAFLDPGKLVKNYWDGFRGYYYSPGRFFVTAGLFVLIDSIWNEKFLGIVVTSKVVPQFTIIMVSIIIVYLSTKLIYFRQKRSSVELLILAIYTVSLWTIVFVPISAISNYFYSPKIPILLIPFYLLILIWNSKVFELSKKQKWLHLLLHIVLFFGGMALFIWWIADIKYE